MLRLVRVCAVVMGVMMLAITGVMVAQRGGPPSWIAVVKDDAPDPMGYDYRVYLIDAETRETRRITQAEPHDYFYLTWAPDGRSLIFESHRDNFGPTITPTGIFRLALSGRIEPIIAEESLAWTPTGGNGAGQFYPWDRAPRLSPDGKWIAFGQSQGKEPPQAMVVATDHLSTLAEVKPLPLDIQYFYNRINMAWSPDGEWLAVIGTASEKEGVSTSLYRVQRDGSAVEMLVEGNRDFTIPDFFAPTWSPDGEWIAFVGRDVTETQDFTIYRVRADGSQLEKLVPAGFYMCDSILWDSDWLIFRGADIQANSALYRMNVNTREMQELPYKNTIGGYLDRKGDV